MRVSLISIPVWTPSTPPLNITYLAGFLKKKGFEISTFDFNIELFHLAGDEGRRFWDRAFLYLWQDKSEFFSKIYPSIIADNLPELVKKVIDYEPDVIGISVYSIWLTKVLIDILKQRLPEVKIVVGGQVCFPDFYGEELIEFDGVDAVVVGEGEIPFLSYLTGLSEGGMKGSIVPGVVYKEDGRIIDGGMGELVRDLDSLPFPDYSDLDLDLYTKDFIEPLKPSNSLSILMSRGCPKRCDFCLQRVIWRSFRTRSAENVYLEMKEFHERFGVTFYQFNDLLINGDVRLLSRLCDILIDSGLPVKWGGDIGITGKLYPELFERMKKAGCEFIVVGIESGSNRVLKAMGKGYTREDASRILQWAHCSGLRIFSNFIVGHPMERWVDFLETVDFLRSNRNALLDPPTFSLLIIQKGTPIYEKKDRYKLAIDGKDALGWRKVDGTNDLEERKRRMKIIDHLFRELYGKKLTFTDIEKEELKI